MSDFRDSSQSNSWDYSSFVRTYALYLDERLEFRMQSRRGKRSVFGLEEEDEEANQAAAGPRATPVREMKTEHIFSRMQHLQQLLERFLACRPTGEAKNNRVVIVALYPTVKESFQIYYDMTEIMGIFIDRFMELQVHDCVKVHEVFCRIGKQFDELDMLYSWCRTIGIARSSEYPELEKITPKKLEVMDEFIRDKSALAQTIKHTSIEETPAVLEEPATPNVQEEDMNAIKALPPPAPQAFTTFSDDDDEQIVKQQEGNLLSLGDDAIRSEEHSDKLALALFDHQDHDGGAWETFNEDAADWETALVESTSNLSGQKVALAAGFHMLLLDGMYKQQPETKGGSASSVALGPTGRPQTLALPAAPTSATSSADPFAASLTVAPPAYVQMSEMEKKQKLLVEEQLMWQQYARDGMQGQLGMAKIQHHNPYNMGGYTHSY